MREFLMHDVFEEKLKDELGDGFEDKIAERISEFGGLLSRGAAVRLLCKEHGIDVERKLTLREAEGSPLPFSFTAKIDRIYPVQSYPGRPDRSVRLHLSDSSGPATLVLWNEQAALVEGELSIGDTISCAGAYFRSGEMALSRGGKIAKTLRAPIIRVSKLTAGVCNIEGEVRALEPDYPYIDRKSGEEKTLSSFQFCEGNDCRRVVIWSSPEGTPVPEPGDHLLLENVLFRNGELHFNSSSRMVKKISASEKSGKLEKITPRGELAVFSIGGTAFALPMGEALAMLGIRAVPDGVSPNTLLLIKSQELLGRNLKYRLADGQLSWLSF
jgi:hypothetical protein